MENTLFIEDKAELVVLARKRLALLDAKEKLDAGSQIRYREYVGFLRANDAYLYYPEEILQEIASIPLNMEMLGKLGDFTRLYSIFQMQSISTLRQIFEVDRITFNGWSRTSNGKWEMLMEMRKAVVEKWDEWKSYGEVCFAQRVFPELEEDRSYTMAEKVELAMKQYLEALSQYVTYFPKLREIAERLSMLFRGEMNQEEILDKIKVSRERLRQFKERYISQLLSGHLEEVPHLCLDAELLRQIADFEQGAPRYKSVATVNHFWDCPDYRNTILPYFLRSEKLCEVDNSTSYAYFDQSYLIPENESVEEIKKYVSSLIKILGNSPKAEIRPMTRIQIQEKLAAFDPDFVFDGQVVSELLEQHQWVEKCEGEGEERWQLKYEHLYDYQKIARIIYELKRVNYEEIRRADAERAKDGKCILKIRENCMSARQNYKWACTAGIEGSFVYEESGVAPMALMNVVSAYANDCKVFTFTEISAYLNSLNYLGDLNENSVKSYILRTCVSSIDDPNFYCLDSLVGEFPHHRWRNRNRYGVRSWLVSRVVQMLQEEATHTLVADNLLDLLFEQAREAGVVLDMENPISYMFAKSETNDLIRREGGNLVLTEQGQTFTDEECEGNHSLILDAEHCKEVCEEIAKSLKASKRHEVMLKKLKEKCSALLEGKSKTFFYSIVNTHLPFEVERVKHKEKLYLKLPKA